MATFEIVQNPPAIARPLAELAACFISMPAAKSSRLFGELIAGLREAVTQGRNEEAASVLRSVITPALDYTRAQSLHRIRSGLQGGAPSRYKVKLAVLGSFTTKQLVGLIDLFLFGAGVDVEIYEGDYGVFRQEIIDPASGLYDFGPQVVFLATTWRDISHRPGASSNATEVSDLMAAEVSQWSGLWDLAHQRLGCQVIQNNFAIPPWRSFANHEIRQPGSMGRFVAQVNQLMGDCAPSFVTIHDIDHLAAMAGRWRWDDPRFFHQAKLPCDPECLVDYAHSVASLIAAPLGLTKKCLVLDLDNTLWGGVIGDDGLGGIRLGQGDAEGEAFIEFQKYIQSLRARGVLLAVCSKNNHATALEVFEKHPEMVLRRDDISCFVANWHDKATNLRAIAKELNIGTDSLVFVDDNPAERAIVRQLVPEVAVPELPEDVTGYIRTLEQQRYFQVLSVAAEDFQRTEFYKADTMRREVQTSVADMRTFLQSLEMTAHIGPITASTLERSAQLIQRSNQFNLTTRRRSAAQLMALMDDSSWLTCTVSLADRFGDNGLISVVLAAVREDMLEIDTWLMSCRVLKRGVEHFVLNHLCQAALQRGLKGLRGVYLPTSKNALVRDHYAGLGFTQMEGGENGQTDWELTWASPRQPLTTFIKEIN